MDIEKKDVKLLINNTNMITKELLIIEDLPEEPDLIILKIKIGDKCIRCSHDNYFSALIDVRKHLEKENIQIMCNGAAKNVYPSAMQFDMGNTRKAYKLYLAQSPKMADMVDIFEYEEGLEFVSIDKQIQFFNQWADIS